VPIATASSRKISGAVAMIHWMAWMVGVSPGGFLVFDLTSKFRNRLIQINPGREWDIVLLAG
jgi:hypothetical protein